MFSLAISSGLMEGLDICIAIISARWSNLDLAFQQMHVRLAKTAPVNFEAVDRATVMYHVCFLAALKTMKDSAASYSIFKQTPGRNFGWCWQSSNS